MQKLYCDICGKESTTLLTYHCGNQQWGSIQEFDGGLCYDCFFKLKTLCGVGIKRIKVRRLLMNDREIVDKVKTRERARFRWLYQHGYSPLIINCHRVLVRYTRWIDEMECQERIRQIFVSTISSDLAKR